MANQKEKPVSVQMACECKLAETMEDLTVIGAFYEKVKDKYDRKKQRPYYEVVFSKGPAGDEPKLVESSRQQFLTEDEKSFVEIGSDSFQVGWTGPFGQLEGFFQEAKAGLGIYFSTVGIRDLQRIEMNYRNEISMEGPIVDLDEYFSFQPKFDENLGQPGGPFIVGIHFPKNGEKDILRLTLSGVKPSDQKKGIRIVFDIAYYSVGKIATAGDEVANWIDTAKKEMKDSVALCCTEKLRAMLI